MFKALVSAGLTLAAMLLATEAQARAPLWCWLEVKGKGGRMTVHNLRDRENLRGDWHPAGLPPEIAVSVDRWSTRGVFDPEMPTFVEVTLTLDPTYSGQWISAYASFDGETWESGYGGAVTDEGSAEKRVRKAQSTAKLPPLPAGGATRFLVRMVARDGRVFGPWTIPLDQAERERRIAEAYALIAAPDSTACREPAVRSPTWTRKPSAEQIAAAYPKKARRLEISGRVSIACQVTAAGTLTDCAVRTETPVEFGLGEAALSLARFYRMQPTVDGVSVEGSTVVIPISFMPD